jgi:nitrite reductase/ring-hydroxylating ferredoxin subunit/uncharacterized membrane protein
LVPRRAVNTVGMRLSDTADGVERWSWLDGTVGVLRRAADAVLPPGRVRDALHGVWLGHPLHPALILLPLGSWISATTLDLLPGVPGTERSARTLVGLGVLSAAPTAAAGAADWSRLHPEQQRVGVLHAAANLATVTLNGLSWLDRRRGRHGRGRALSLAALAVGTAGAYLGGHLSYREAAGASHAETAAHLLPAEFTPLCRMSDLPEGRPVRLTLADAPVFVLRRGTQVVALADQCSHLGGPLHEGEVSSQDGRPCVTCPWHGSVFRLDDGSVVHGPATAPQPALEVQVSEDGAVSARLPGVSG